MRINWFSLTALVLISIVAYKYLDKDTWTLFVYSDKESLNIVSDTKEGYKSKEECLQAGYIISNNGKNAFECGSNCKYDGGLNICDETFDRDSYLDN